jgi:hypothetical protein
MIPHIWKALLSLLWFKWQHVGTITLTGNDAIYYKGDNFQTYIHCFESCWGHRKVKIKGHHNTTSRSIDIPTPSINRTFFLKVKSTKVYQLEIYPWLCGRNSKEIPSYKKVKSGKWDFVRNLKDKANIILNKSNEKT